MVVKIRHSSSVHLALPPLTFSVSAEQQEELKGDFLETVIFYEMGLPVSIQYQVFFGKKYGFHLTFFSKAIFVK